MSTYNHESFIEQAIEGVMLQQCSFEYQLIIGDDLSNDNTRLLCEMMANKYANRIKLLDSDQKYGQNHNLHRIIRACTSKYIALCEGDDYWTNPFKLQKQVDFMEANPEFVMCFHQVQGVDQHQHIIKSVEAREMLLIYDGIKFFHVFVPTLSLLFRNCLELFPSEFFKVKSTDAFIVGMLSGYGKGADLGFIGGCYRQHEGGCYNRLSEYEKYKQSIVTRRLMKRSSYFSPDQKTEIRKELKRRLLLFSKIFLKRLDLIHFIKIVYISLF